MLKAADNLARRALRLKAAAQYLSVSPRRVRSLIEAGELPIIKLSETDHAPWLVDVRDLDNLVERRKVTLR
jgi:hypothetical protein